MTSPSRGGGGRGRGRGLLRSEEWLLRRLEARARAAARQEADLPEADPSVLHWPSDRQTVVLRDPAWPYWRCWAIAELPASVTAQLSAASRARLARLRAEGGDGGVP